MAVLYPASRGRWVRPQPDPGESAVRCDESVVRCGLLAEASEPSSTPGTTSSPVAEDTPSLQSPTQAPARAATQPTPSSPRLRRSISRFVGYLRGDRWLPQLVRFALVGGASNISYFLLFMAFYGGGAQVANLTGSIVSTIIANELHRRLTFRAADRVGWLATQLEGGGLALAGLAITSGALAVLDLVAPHLANVTEACAVIAITAAVGTLRFLTLRLWVF